MLFGLETVVRSIWLYAFNSLLFQLRCGAWQEIEMTMQCTE